MVSQPEEQLLDVIAELENLLENDTMPLPLESLEQPFDQVRLAVVSI